MAPFSFLVQRTALVMWLQWLLQQVAAGGFGGEVVTIIGMGGSSATLALLVSARLGQFGGGGGHGTKQFGTQAGARAMVLSVMLSEEHQQRHRSINTDTLPIVDLGNPSWVLGLPGLRPSTALPLAPSPVCWKPACAAKTLSQSVVRASLETVSSFNQLDSSVAPSAANAAPAFNMSRDMREQTITMPM